MSAVVYRSKVITRFIFSVICGVEYDAFFRAKPPKVPKSPECTRDIPESITDKTVFPLSRFRLRMNTKYPFEHLGYETIDFENGDELLIENIGCENFTLVFRYETSRFSHDLKDAKFWYKTAIELVSDTIKGIEKIPLPKNGLKALKEHINKNKKLKFKEQIEFCESETKCVVSVDGVKKLGKKTN